MRACAAKHDPVVSLSSAIGLFTHFPPPLYLEADHNTIKEPNHLQDLRYLAFKNDLDSAFVEPFSQLCLQALRADTPQARRIAAERFDRQYGEAAERCAELCKGGRNVTDEDLYEIVPRIWQFGALGDTSPARAMTHVLIDFKYEHDPRLKL